MKKSILFICPYPLGQSPSQRFRFEQYFELLKENGFTIKIHSFLSKEAFAMLYKPSHPWKKIGYVLIGYLKRLIVLPYTLSSNFIFIHREASPMGPPFFEWITSKIFGKRIIYDFDDAIWIPNTSKENSVIDSFKWNRKVKLICEWSFRVSAGNKYLAEYAKVHNNQVTINPTTIETQFLHNPKCYPSRKKNKMVTIGWTGTHSTLKYLTILLPVFESLSKRFSNQLSWIVIADKPPNLVLPNLRFITWSKETEINDLLEIDIGIMPLQDDAWAYGKCGFKALQYMALNIPAVVSSVGVNRQIIDHGVNGFLCNTLADWEDYLTVLIQDEELRKKIGKSGRIKVIENYSVSSNSSNFLRLFDE